MTSVTFHMLNRIEAVDPMVLTLKSEVEGILPDEAMWRFDICLSESLANLVLHADTHLREETIDVVLEVAEGVITAEIFDPKGALPFDVRKKARCLSDIDSMSEHGRGLGLIIECADGVDYGPSLDRHRLSLTFKART